MKRRLLSIVMILAILLSAFSGCSNSKEYLSKGSVRYSDASADLIRAAENVCGAHEASESLREDLINGSDISYSAFKKGVYYTLDSDDLRSYDFLPINEYLGIDVWDSSELRNMTEFVKGYSDMICADVIEAKNETCAENLFERIMDYLVYRGYSRDSIDRAAETRGFEYGLVEAEDTFALMMVGSDINIAGGAFVQQNGNVIIMSVYLGRVNDGLLEEYYELMNEVDYWDMEDLVDS